MYYVALVREPAMKELILKTSRRREDNIKNHF